MALDPDLKDLTAKKIDSLYKKMSKDNRLTRQGKETMELGYKGLGDDYAIVEGADFK